jgi:HD superfamily phosphohydrolase
MIIHDALYGAFEIPSFLDVLVRAPEFRRLAEVRLINIDSASLSSLADVRRYSHTLGVLRLALLNPLVGLGEGEFRAFLASIIIHDAGTPAFAHLFEYFLSERYNWSHEGVLANLLTATHHSDQYAHQIFASQTPSLEKLCKVARIDFDLVSAFIRGDHAYSRLIFGSLDFDNLDNVARMNWMLGHQFDLSAIVSIARNLGIGANGRLVLPESEANNVRLWQTLRSKAYEILVFDEATVAAQAVLSKAIMEAMDSRSLTPSDWHYDDRGLISALERTPSIKKRLRKDLMGELPSLYLLHVRKDNLAIFDALGRVRITGLLEEFVQSRMGPTSKAYGYIFRDRGTFSKRVDFVDSASGRPWSVGSTSDSLVLYGFAKCRGGVNVDARQIGLEFGEWIDAKVLQ